MPTPLDSAYLAAIGICSPWIARRLLRSAKGRANLFEKLTGKVYAPTKSQPRVWFHGVSVGEIHLLRNVVNQFLARRPDCDAVVSSSTETGLAEARKYFDQVIAWPFDFSWAMQNAIARIRPDLIVLAESELWPTMLTEAQRARVPVIVMNGRFSPKSAHRWRMLRPLAQSMFERIAGFAVQTEQIADQLMAIGVPSARISVTGSVKFDGLQTDRGNARTHALADLFDIQPDELIWVAGSTQSPEEQGCIDIYRRLKLRYPQLRLILVPRQKDRFDEVANLLGRSELPFVCRSALPCPVPANAVVLVDTIGELNAVWGLADVAFVGGSLDGHRGGQNMIEPAAYGAGVIFGKHVWNFAQTAAQLVAHQGALKVDDFDELGNAVERLLHPEVRRTYGQAAQQFVSTQQGATQRTLAMLDRFLPQRVQIRAA